MAYVILDRVWLNVAENPSDYLALRFVTGFSRELEKPGRVQRMAGGRTRLIRQAGQSLSWSLGFKAVTREQLAWLEEHVGVLMAARDDRGHKVFGAFLSTPVAEHLYNQEGDVQLELTEVTFSEHVA